METQKQVLTYFEIMIKKLDFVMSEIKEQKLSSKETQKIKMLQEILKEQIRDEDSRYTAR